MTSPIVKGWLRQACGQRVEHLPMPHPGQLIDRYAAPQGVQHTIEGSLQSGLAVFRQHYAPTFTVGGNRIIQHIPLGYMAAALEHRGDPPTNGWARVQIELAGRSHESPWLPDKQTLESLAHLLAALSFPNVAGVPLSRPFPDVMPPPPWAFPGFSRRRSGHWGKVAGWYGHVEVPENAHWDPGALEWQKVLARARVIKQAHPQHPKPKRVARPRHAVAAAWQRWRPNTGLGTGGGHPQTL